MVVEMEIGYMMVVRRYSLTIFLRNAYITCIFKFYLYKYGNVVYDRHRHLSNITVVILSYHINGLYTIYMIFYGIITYYYYLDIIYKCGYEKNILKNKLL